jgi:hypothetical protein
VIIIVHQQRYPLLVDYYYHWVYTSAGGLLLSPCLYLCWWTITITGSIPLLVDYYYHVSIPLLVDYYYHRVYTSAGGLLITGGMIRPVETLIYTVPKLDNNYYDKIIIKIISELRFTSLQHRHR